MTYLSPQRVFPFKS